MQKILLGQVLADVNKPNAVFDIVFRKDDGNISVKKGVMNRSSNLNERKMMNRNGLLRCYIPKSDEIFDATIDLIVRFNGMKIHRPEENGGI